MNTLLNLLTSNATASAIITHEKKRTKADHAREIYDEMMATSDKKPSRKEIIKRFVEEAGLTPHGANTYLYNIDKSMKTKQTS